jgi:NADH-quinone oxidoreductase subunit L
MTHAFFKALLFLGAGSVIHALGGEQDMRKMGGIRKLIPYTFAVMWIGSLALAGIGIPDVLGFAGFYSKDMILEAAWASDTFVGHFAYWLGVIAAFLTAFYSWRLLIMTFDGAPRASHDVMHHVHESPKVMLVPLFVLAFGAIFAGIAGFNIFVGEGRDEFWGASLKVLPAHDAVAFAHEGAFWVGFLPLLAGLSGIGLAYVFYQFRPELPGLIAGKAGGLYRFLYNKWYFDELYDFLFVRPAKAIGTILWKGGDGALIDGLGPDGIASVTRDMSIGASRLETGYLYHYAFAMVIGVVALVSWFTLHG